MTKESKERIQYLLIQYLENRATPAERERLSAYLAEEPEEGGWMELMEELMSTESSLSEYDPVAWEGFVEQLKEKNKYGGAPVPVVSIRRSSFLRQYRWWTAAAIVLLVSGSGFWWYSRPSGPQKIQQTATQNDVLPGGNKAVLTLGSGQKIILDSVANGRLVSQGNVQVLKLNNGRLAYNIGVSPGKPIGQPTPVIYNTLSTPRGGQYQLILPDGSKVWLNAASSITYPTAFSGNERDVSITGEAYFEVVHNNRRPFRVKVGSQVIEDIGTAFDVNAYEDESSMRTTLLEGSIEVSGLVLKPGQQVSVNRQGQSSLVKNVDLDQVVAWKNGVFAFNDADLTTVMRQLARWYDIEVEYTGKVPPGAFDGEIGRSLTLNQVLTGLTKTRIHYTIEGKRIIIGQ